MTDAATLLHGTAIAVSGRAVLIRGASGAGKSDLALRCLDHAASPLLSGRPMLVADDQVEIRRTGCRLRVLAPATLRGLLEVRGIGIVSVASVAEAELALIVDLVGPEAVERLPSTARTADILGLGLPLTSIWPFAASAPAKLLLALDRVAPRTPRQQP